MEEAAAVVTTVAAAMGAVEAHMAVAAAAVAVITEVEVSYSTLLITIRNTSHKIYLYSNLEEISRTEIMTSFPAL